MSNIKNRCFWLIECFVMLFVATSCGENDGTEDGLEVTTEKANPISLSRSEQNIVNGEVDMALSFFQKFVEDNSESNAICSPFSLSNMLTLLSNGVSDDARAEINSVYGVDANDAKGLNDLHSRLLRELRSIDSRVTFMSANAVDLCPMYDFYPDFERSVVSGLNAELLRYDLYQKSGIAQFNQWCSGKTNGLIKNMLDENMTYCGYTVASADYFKAKWTIPFDGKNTKNEDFTCEDGTLKKVPTMVGQKYISAYSDNTISLIQIPYGNQAYRFSIILPGDYQSDNEISIVEAVNKLNFDSWKKMNSEKMNYHRIINLPRFSISTKGDIAPQVRAIGFNELFKDGAISKISPNLPENEKFLSFIQQAVTISVEENGTTAASVTVTGGITENIVPEEIFINRPFMFIIDEASTGTILYAGVVRKL